MVQSCARSFTELHRLDELLVPAASKPFRNEGGALSSFLRHRGETIYPPDRGKGLNGLSDPPTDCRDAAQTPG